ncbi:MAG: hypothetical protein R3E48_19205 [Burkholderiaceae bacterium]
MTVEVAHRADRPIVLRDEDAAKQAGSVPHQRPVARAAPGLDHVVWVQEDQVRLARQETRLELGDRGRVLQLDRLAGQAAYGFDQG